MAVLWKMRDYDMNAHILICEKDLNSHFRKSRDHGSPVLLPIPDLLTSKNLPRPPGALCQAGKVSTFVNACSCTRNPSTTVHAPYSKFTFPSTVSTPITFHTVFHSICLKKILLYGAHLRRFNLVIISLRLPGRTRI